MLFVDSSAFIALNCPENSNHQRAVKFVKSLLGETAKITTSFLVVAEAATEIRKRLGYQAVLAFLARFEKEGITVFHVNEVIRLNAKDMFTGHEKVKELSFLDCLKVATMHYYGIHKVFTFNAELDELKVVRVPKN